MKTVLIYIGWFSGGYNLGIGLVAIAAGEPLGWLNVALGLASFYIVGKMHDE